MARKTSLTSLKEISEINLTPLMDLTFILLIAFIITYPLIEQGVPMNLPKGRADELDMEETRTISVDSSGALFLDDQPVDLPDLRQQMIALGLTSPDATVFVRADEAIQYGRVMEAIKILHEAKITRTALVMQEADQ